MRCDHKCFLTHDLPGMPFLDVCKFSEFPAWRPVARGYVVPLRKEVSIKESGAAWDCILGDRTRDDEGPGVHP